MDTKEPIDFNSMTTFDIAFSIATGQYSEAEKFAGLRVIKEREPKNGKSSEGSASPLPVPLNVRPPLKGSKAEKIHKLGLEGKTAQETFALLNKKGTSVYYPEIYRVYKRYRFI